MSTHHFLVEETFYGRFVLRVSKLWYRNTKLESTCRKDTPLSTFIFRWPSAPNTSGHFPMHCCHSQLRTSLREQSAAAVECCQAPALCWLRPSLCQHSVITQPLIYCCFKTQLHLPSSLAWLTESPQQNLLVQLSQWTEQSAYSDTAKPSLC